MYSTEKASCLRPTAGATQVRLGDVGAGGLLQRSGERAPSGRAREHRRVLDRLFSGRLTSRGREPRHLLAAAGDVQRRPSP